MTIEINRNLVRTKAFDAAFNAVSEDGEFKGYVSVFGNKDEYDEIVVKGAFRKSLESLLVKNRVPPILWQHQTGNPIGDWKSLEEDHHGLASVGQLWLKEAPQALIAHKGLKTKTITGLSIGYRVLDADYDSKAGALLLTELDLVEASIVTTPANDDARVEAVKSKLARGEAPDRSEVERYLREAGFSKSWATSIVARGYTKDRSDSDSKASSEILTALRGFTL